VNPPLKQGLDVGYRRVHLVGIGGAGMSAIARVLFDAGIKVTGSDMKDSAALTPLRVLGIRVEVGHGNQLDGIDALIASAAVPDSNPEIVLALRLGIPVISRGDALARIVSNHRTIAISGTHGKTTTSGMVATILEVAGLSPTYLLGADLAGRGPGGRLGSGGLAVVEADEAYGSFLWLRPAVALITNVDEDHLDHYGTRAEMEKAFEQFMSRASEQVIVCSDDADAMRLKVASPTLKYGFKVDSDVAAGALFTSAAGSTFDLFRGGEFVSSVRLLIGGRHNVLNALGAAAACMAVGVPPEDIVAGLEAFQGVSRRFEYRGQLYGADLVDDYAHHPAEIEATLAAARGGPWRRLVAVFQPHLYSRTKLLWDEFGSCLASADVVVITEIYGAREQAMPGITGKLIVDSVCDHAPGKRVAYFPHLDEAAGYVREVMRRGDLVLSLGAGDITTFHERLKLLS